MGEKRYIPSIVHPCTRWQRVGCITTQTHGFRTKIHQYPLVGCGSSTADLVGIKKKYSSWWLNRTSCSTVCKKTNKCSRKQWVFINTFQIFYPDMFRHMVAILRGSWVPYKLLKQCSVLWVCADSDPSRVAYCRSTTTVLCYGCVQTMTRPVWPVVVPRQLFCVMGVCVPCGS
jgi:hypothetical protein